VNTISSQPLQNEHAVKMDRMYRTQRHIYDFTRKYYLIGRDRTIANIKPKPGQTVLEVGCGTGRNLALIARMFPQAKLFGLDISQEMLAQTKKTFFTQRYTVTLSHRRRCNVV
jgi:S-adenosylmethionine-diacylgycerolhomoserine-N-methlytransferase